MIESLFWAKYNMRFFVVYIIFKSIKCEVFNMKLNRCSVCGRFPYVSKSFATSFGLHESQVKCRCHNSADAFYSVDSESCVNAAVDDWNEHNDGSVHPKIKWG